MRMACGWIGAACVVVCSAAQAAQTINFDDIVFPGGNPLAIAYPAAGYQGFDWSGEQGANSWAVSPNDATGWFGGTVQPYSHSGNVFGWGNSASELALTVHGGGTFDLVSLWMRTWPTTTAIYTLRGFLGGVQTFIQTVPATQIYALQTLNFTHIDRFTIDHQTTSLLIDDMTVNNVSAVPEPASAVLAGLGVGCLALVFGRRRREREDAVRSSHHHCG